MQNPLMQTIEALAKEKGIEADTIITAIEDAVLTASRKYYKTNENLKTRFNQETGQVDLFAIKHIVETVENPATEISLKEAVDNQQAFEGRLRGVEQDDVLLEAPNGRMHRLPLRLITRGRLEVEF